jgi:Polyketide cyclase / dehydrase and lipid transport
MMVHPQLALFRLVSALCVLASATPASAEDDQQWRLVSENGGVTIYSRVRSGSPLKEFKAIGRIEAPTHAVHNVINDVEGYPKFMPFTAECRVVKREGSSLYAYQRISPKIVGDRDYTLLIEEKSWSTDTGVVYAKHWKPANHAGPPEKKSVLRVNLCDGGWLLEPETPDKTRATYTIYTDTGGSLPAFVANAASSIGIRKIFTAVRRQVKDPKYRENRDFLEPRQ